MGVSGTRGKKQRMTAIPIRKGNTMKVFKHVCVPLSLIACAAGFIGVTATPVLAGLVTFSFTGAVDSVDPSLGFSPGQTLAGSYTFESTTILSNPDNRYNGAITSLTGSLSPYTATLGTGSNFIAVRNGLSTGDHYLISAPLNPSPAVTGLSVRFEMELIDPTATAFTSEALAATPPSLSAFATKSFRLIFEDAAHANVHVLGTLTSLTAVPLPAAVVLFGAGLVALAGLGAGSWRQRKNSIAA